MQIVPWLWLYLPSNTANPKDAKSAGYDKKSAIAQVWGPPRKKNENEIGSNSWKGQGIGFNEYFNSFDNKLEKEVITDLISSALSTSTKKF